MPERRANISQDYALYFEQLMTYRNVLAVAVANSEHIFQKIHSMLGYPIWNGRTCASASR